MKSASSLKRILSALLVFVMVLTLVPVHAHAAEVSDALKGSLEKAKNYTNSITINNASNDPATVVKNFKTHFTWDNEKRENSKSYLFDWSYYNGVVFEGIEYLYEVTGDTVYKDYVVEYMSSLIASNGTWATCTNNTSKQAAGYNATHGADCYKTASLLLDAYEMTGDSRYLTMAATLYADLDTAAKSYSLSKAGNNYRHTWATDPSPDLWLDGLYMILPFRAEYAKYIGDTEELDLIVSRMQWVSDNMYNSSKGLFYHAADSASSNSGTYWLRSIGWYAAAIVDIMDSMEGENLETMKAQLVKLVDGMKACQNASNGMWLNNMNASHSSSNPYETSGTALTCYAVMKAVNNGWLDESYADMAILAFNGICNEKLSGTTLTDICFKGAPGSSNSTFYDNEGKGVGPFIMFYAEVLEYANKAEEEPEATEPEATEPEATEPEATEPEATEPETTVPEEEENVYQGTGHLEADFVYTLDSDGINSGEKYLIVYNGRALENNNGVDNNPTVSISNNTITLSDDSSLAWTITLSSGNNYYVENNGSYVNLKASGNDPIGTSATVYITGTSTYKFRNASSSGAYLRYSSSQLWCAGTNGSNNALYLYRCTGTGTGEEVVFTVAPVSEAVQSGASVALNATVTVGGQTVSLSNCSIQWESANNACATVSGGIVSGVAAGETQITAVLSAVNGTALKENIVLTIPVTVSSAHYYESVVVAPTCTEGGYTVHTCANCGDSYTDSYTEATGHNYKAVVTAPTCETAGYTTYTCACGDTYTADEVAALGHNYKAVVTAPTCETAGYTTYTCACGDTYTADEVAALGHNYKAVVTAPTCETAGYTTYTCACGDTYTADEVAALGHNYKAVVTAPTCETAGYTTYTCTCGDTYTADKVAALGHSYETVITDATCTEEGSVVRTCVNCGESDTQIIPTIGHSYETVTVEATCTTDGSVTTTCDRCGDTTVEVIPALGHNYKAVVTAPTCETAGYTTYTCACGDTYTADKVAALGHSYKAVVTAPTCETAGYTTYTCACGDTYTADEVAALGHSYKAVVTAPTCETAGYTTYTCDTCGDTYVADQVAALGHNYETEMVEATCETAGSVTTTCTVCGDSTVEVIPALGHGYETVITDATCTEEGSVVRTCSTCGDSDTQIIPARGHSYETVTVEATCTTDGSVTTACTVCGDTTVEVIPALGHNYNAVVTVPTCTEAGYTTYTCACGDTYTADEVGALGHNYNAVVTAPTCTTGGYTTYTCGTCGDTYIAEQVAALGHNYNAVVTAPTCTTGGYTTYTCGTCGDTYIAEQVAALGHNYNTVVTAPACETAGYTTYTCACGDSYVADQVAALGHSYTTEETDGYLVYTCVHCGDSYSESIGWIVMPGTYVLDTDGVDVGSAYKYIVVGADKDYALTLSGSTIGAAAVNINGNTLTLDNGTAYEFYFQNNSSKENGSYLLTQDGTKGVYHMGGNMYYGADNKGYWHIGSASNGKYQMYDYDNLNWYLNYGYVWGSDSVSRFAVSSTARYVRLFQAVDSYVRLSGDTNQTWIHGAAVTESAVLEKVMIQTSTDGSNVSGTVAVTADMISWDKPFDGYTAGTYTAEVTWNGIAVGTITVTVTGEHDYTTVVVDPTCTAAGTVTTTCTVCGKNTVETIAALGHSYTVAEVDGYMVYTCGRCGDSYSEKIAPDVTYDQVSAIASGNRYVITLYSGGKYYALSHAGNGITAVQVTVSGGQITSEITEDLLWTYEDSKLFYEDGDDTYYLYAKPASGWFSWFSAPTLSVSTTNSTTVSFSSSKLKVGSYYLRYSGGSIKLDRSSTTTYLFQENEN